MSQNNFSFSPVTSDDARRLHSFFNQIRGVAQLKAFSHGFRMEEETSTYNMKNATEMI